jgi:hypothetical protein
MLGRLYIFFRLFDHFTFWTGERAERVWYGKILTVGKIYLKHLKKKKSKINGFQADPTFALKAYLKYRAFYFLTSALGFSIIVFGVALRTLER